MSGAVSESHYVLVNDQGQYSVWPAAVSVPNGWEAVGEARDKSACLDFIDLNWKDMRPVVLQQSMAKMAVTARDDSPMPVGAEDDLLVQRLSSGEHAVELINPGRGARQIINCGVVRMGFPDTRGAPTITMKVGPYLNDLESYNESKKHYSLSGDFYLDGAHCKCHAYIDLETLRGTARVERL